MSFGTSDSELSMSPHLTEVVSSCASSMYALRVLRSHGLPPSAIQQVARMTTVATLMYASPACWGYTQASDRARMEQLLNKLKRYGFLPSTAPTVQQMAATADDSLFRAVITNESHVLRSFLPESRSHSYNLRTRVHGYKLPPKDDKNFIPRMLSKNIYWQYWETHGQIWLLGQAGQPPHNIPHNALLLVEVAAVSTWFCLK